MAGETPPVAAPAISIQRKRMRPPRRPLSQASRAAAKGGSLLRDRLRIEPAARLMHLTKDRKRPIDRCRLGEGPRLRVAFVGGGHDRDRSDLAVLRIVDDSRTQSLQILVAECP